MILNAIGGELDFGFCWELRALTMVSSQVTVSLRNLIPNTKLFVKLVKLGIYLTN